MWRFAVRSELQQRSRESVLCQTLGFYLDQGDRDQRIAQTVIVFGNLSLHHSDLIAIHKPGTIDTIFVDFVREHVPLTQNPKTVPIGTGVMLGS